MKDLRLFSGATEIGWLRVDSISGEGNLTVMETYKLNDRLRDMDPEDDNYQLKVELATNFMKIPHTFGDIIEFATENDLTLIMEDGAGKAPTESLVGGVTITTASPLTGGTEDVAYDQDIEAEGGSGSYSFAVTVGTLPTGLTLSSAGALTGTPTVPGASAFTVTATDTVFGFSASKAFSLTIT